MPRTINWGALNRAYELKPGDYQEVVGMEDPVVQVISEAGGDVLYTIRIQGDRFTPKVFAPGSYTVRIGEPGTDALQTYLGLVPETESERAIQVSFGGNPH